MALTGRLAVPATPSDQGECSTSYAATHAGYHRPSRRERASARSAHVCRAVELMDRPPTAAAPQQGRSWADIRRDFDILDQNVELKPLVYLDSAATSQKPKEVVAKMSDYYRRYNANVHRGIHFLSTQATTAFEDARRKVAALINASPEEVVFTKNATEALNLVAYSWALDNLKPGDEILVSVAEHHANMVPWQLAAKRTGAVLRHVPLRPDTQEIDIQAYKGMLSSKTKMVALVHVSNMLGCVLPVHDVVEEAHKVGAVVLLDACQSVPNMPVDVRTLGADFLAASAHKMCGPTGIGFLWGRSELLEAMPPYQGGGEMIETVGLDSSTYAPPPTRFEAGTPAIAEAIGFGAAADYIRGIGLPRIQALEAELGGYLHQELSAVEGVTIYGPEPRRGRAALCAFNVEGVHPNDLSTIMDQEGVAVRAGHHCTQPLHNYLGISSSARASLYFYNTQSEIDVLIHELKEAVSFFK